MTKLGDYLLSCCMQLKISKLVANTWDLIGGLCLVPVGNSVSPWLCSLHWLLITPGYLNTFSSLSGAVRQDGVSPLDILHHFLLLSPGWWATSVWWFLPGGAGPDLLQARDNTDHRGPPALHHHTSPCGVVRLVRRSDWSAQFWLLRSGLRSNILSNQLR